jgi:hypothetical protein
MRLRGAYDRKRVHEARRKDFQRCTRQGASVKVFRSITLARTIGTMVTQRRAQKGGSGRIWEDLRDTEYEGGTESTAWKQLLYN